MDRRGRRRYGAAPNFIFGVYGSCFDRRWKEVISTGDGGDHVHLTPRNPTFVPPDLYDFGLIESGSRDVSLEAKQEVSVSLVPQKANGILSLDHCRK